MQGTETLRIDSIDPRFVIYRGRRMARVIGGDGTETTDIGPAGPDQGGQGGGQDFSPLMSRLDQFEQRFDTIEDQLSDNEGYGLEGDDEYAEPGPDEYQGYDDPESYEAGYEGGYDEAPDAIYQDPDTGELVDAEGIPIDEGYDEGGYQDFDPQEIAAQAAAQARAEAREEIQPVLDAWRDQEMVGLEQQYPELGTQEGAEPVIQAALERAERYGNPDLINDPAFVEETYLAMKGRQAAEGEIPAGAENVQMEVPGGQPAAAQPKGVWDRIAEQTNPSQRTFWGVG